VKTVLATSIVAALLAGIQTTAWAAGQGAPSDVRVSWSDAASGLMRVTWTNDGAANKLRLEYQDGSVPGGWLTTSDSGGTGSTGGVC
jgi:hypothetical protein